ncbi:MAG: hypothetical protein AB3N17_08900, partial [Tateyamaria sp.]
SVAPNLSASKRTKAAASPLCHARSSLSGELIRHVCIGLVSVETAILLEDRFPNLAVSEFGR